MKSWDKRSSHSLVQPLFLVGDKLEDPWLLSLDIDLISQGFTKRAYCSKINM
jgi:hypothetical protein